MRVFEFLSYLSGQFLTTIFFDYKYLPIYLIIGYMVYLRYKRIREFQIEYYGDKVKKGKQIIKETILIGLISGFFGSIVIIKLGIIISNDTFEYLFIILIALSLINVRYICFSYAAGILALLSLIFDIGSINIPSLLSLTAILHIIKSILIYIDGGKERVPVFIKHNNNIVGAFLTQKYWAIPIVFISLASQNPVYNTINPIIIDWRTLFNYDTIKLAVISFGLSGVISVQDYSDIAITMLPEKKAKQSSIQYFVYSIVLFLLAFISQNNTFIKVIASIFSILGHEGIVIYNNYMERNKEPLFTSVYRGVRVFDILPGSHAEKIGIRKGDIILNINGKGIQTKGGIDEIISNSPPYIWIDLIDLDGNSKTFEYKAYPDGIEDLGIIIMPREKEVTYRTDFFDNFVVVRNLVGKYGLISRKG